MTAKDALLQGAKGVYVKAARVASGVVGSGDAAPDRDQRLKHWLASLTKVHDSLAIAELDVPWWTYRAIDVVDAWLEAHPRPIKVYEYGSGASTLWLARRTDEIWSVEHHAGFGELMKSALADHPNVHLRIVEPTKSSSPRVPSGKEGHDGLDFYDYVTSIEDAPGPFDVIVIDGRAREACLAASVKHLAPGGIIIYDNSARRRYRDPIRQHSGRERILRGLTPTLPYPEQTSIITL